MSPDCKPDPKSSEANKKTTNFLSLPRELHHKILLYTYYIDNDFLKHYSNSYQLGPHSCSCISCDGAGKKKYRLEKEQCLRKFWAKSTNWVLQLRKVDTRVVEDVQYVGRVWVEDFKELLLAWEVGEFEELVEKFELEGDSCMNEEQNGLQKRVYDAFKDVVAAFRIVFGMGA